MSCNQLNLEINKNYKTSFADPVNVDQAVALAVLELTLKLHYPDNWV